MKKRVILPLLAAMISANFASAQTINLSNAEGAEFDHFWSTGCGAGRAAEGLRAGWLEHLKAVKDDCGFQYVRMHGLFHDDMHTCFQKADGTITYNWQYIDDLFDRMLEIGVRPFVEMSFFPEEIAKKDSKTIFWWEGNVTVEEATFAKWHDLIKNFTQHVVDRYGIEEVKSWYFEVWNEPNLTFAFFDGDKSEYFRLYKESVLAVKGVNSDLRVGGPATSNFVADPRYHGERADNDKSIFYSQEKINKQKWEAPWVEDFLRYCEKENLPVDFISTHPYPTDYALDVATGRGKDAVRYVHSTRDDIKWLQDQIKNSKYPDAEIHLTEWSTSPSSRDKMHDELPPAAFVIKVNLENIGTANSLMYWTFTDVFEEQGGGDGVFHGGFGMLNFQGIAKPSYHGYRMLNQLGDKLIYNTDPVCVTRDSKTDKIVALAYNYPEEFIEIIPAGKNVKNYMQSSSKVLDLKLDGLKPNCEVMVEILDNDHGNVMESFRAMGSPKSPSREQISQLKAASWNTKKEVYKADSKGTLTIKREMTPWSCALIKEI